MPQNTTSRPFTWLPVVFMVAALVLRVLGQHHILDSWPNLSPLMAFAFAGAVMFPRPLPWWSWALLLLGLDLLSEGAAWWGQANGRVEVIAAYACYAIAAWCGARLRGTAGVLDTLAGTLACSAMFYLVTNTVSWLTDPAYADATGVAGWLRALTTGTGAPGLPPTIAFFRNSLIADLAGALVLIGLYDFEALLRKLRVMPLLGGIRSKSARA